MTEKSIWNMHNFFVLNCKISASDAERSGAKRSKRESRTFFYSHLGLSKNAIPGELLFFFFSYGTRFFSFWPYIWYPRRTGPARPGFNSIWQDICQTVHNVRAWKLHNNPILVLKLFYQILKKTIFVVFRNYSVSRKAGFLSWLHTF